MTLTVLLVVCPCLCGLAFALGVWRGRRHSAIVHWQVASKVGPREEGSHPWLLIETGDGPRWARLTNRVLNEGFRAATENLKDRPY